MTIISITWCMVSEIWSVMDRYFVILDHFLPFYPSNKPKNQNFEKLKITENNTRRHYHFTHVYHKWRSYDVWFLRYGAWQTQFCHFGPFFALLPPPPKNPKNQNFEKMKKHLKISSFYANVPNIMIICCTVPEIQCVTNVIHIFYFGLFFALLPPKHPKNQNLKKWKKCQEISLFSTCVPKIMITWCTVPEIWCTTDGQTDRQTEGQMDGWMEKVTYRGGCPT